MTYSAVVQAPSGTPTAHAITATSPTDKNAKVQALEQQGPVVAVSPQTTVTSLDTLSPPGPSDPSSPFYSQQWGLTSADFPSAWSHDAGAGETIAIIDTGVRLTHQSFVGHVVAGPDYVADSSGATMVSTSLADNGDPFGHGTHVAGIAAAEDNAGTLGGAPNATILAIRVLDATGAGDSTNVANAITWAADHGADVINLSLGGGPDPAMQAAVAYANSKNVVVVAAAGNGGCGTAADYPAGYSTSETNMIAVAATDNSGNLASYSNFGSYVNIAAPGGTGLDPSTAIYSTWHDSDQSYGVLDGTSMATPFVSAAAALLEETCGPISAAQARDDLAHHGPAVPGQAFNRVDAGAAVTDGC